MSERAGSLPLIGGALCLDFCNTASGFGTGQVVEHLDTLKDLASWAVHAGILPEKDARRMVRSTPRDARSSALGEMVQARTALREIFAALARDSQPSASSLKAMNGKLSRAFHGAVLAAAGGRFVLEFERTAPTPESVLDAVLRSAVDVLARKDNVRIKMCPGRDCGWLFYDDTKNANRVWCEMRVCGSRAKARTRQRHIAEAVSPGRGGSGAGRERGSAASEID